MDTCVRSRHAQATYSRQVVESTPSAVVHRSGWTSLAGHAPSHRVTTYTRVFRFAYSETGRGGIFTNSKSGLFNPQQFTLYTKTGLESVDD